MLLKFLIRLLLKKYLLIYLKVYLFSFEIALKKQTKTIEEQKKKLKKAIKDQGKQLVESNDLIKTILESTEIIYHMKNKKQYLMNLLEKGLLSFII